MPLAREQRKLAAIIAADVVGYSRLMGRDESGTLARLRKNRTEHLDPVLAKYGGRLVKLTGDPGLQGLSPSSGSLSRRTQGLRLCEISNSEHMVCPVFTACAFTEAVFSTRALASGPT